MQIAMFEALSLMPHQGEDFTVGRAFRLRRGGWKVEKFKMSLSEINDLASREPVAVICFLPGFGYAARLGRLYLKLDRRLVTKKFERDVREIVPRETL